MTNYGFVFGVAEFKHVTSRYRENERRFSYSFSMLIEFLRCSLLWY